MYLKQLDIFGFKSFADKTRLTFEPGLIAIVGPNGCGKSNVSDAIRWVLGEQRPTALRCSKLVDVVFNGTDTRKPLGLAEVSITFADCEKELGTEYHEVTVTRRVYRDGTGEYLINKQMCRLKDVQHLFMGTGIGTSSYSVMAQGQIDAILSSKPEDRRLVFEEAAGITKFKADRKEALRKMEQTEQNLLRVADVLREMKRQIATLQRQVGKAKRAKELRDELRGLDIYVSKQKIKGFDETLAQTAANHQQIEQAILEADELVTAAEARQQELHATVSGLEARLQELAAKQAEADSAYARANEVISVNAQRIEEYRSFAERDGREIADTRRQLEEVALQVESLEQKATLLTDSLAASKEALEEAEAIFAESQERIEVLRTSVQSARQKSVQSDRRAAEIRDEIAQLEVASREAILRRERLTAEVQRLAEADEQASANLAEIRAKADAARAAEQEASDRVADFKGQISSLRAEITSARENLGDNQRDLALKEAQLEMMKDEARAKGVLEKIFDEESGDVRLVALEKAGEHTPIQAGERLVEHLPIAADEVETAERLLGDLTLVAGEGERIWFPTTHVKSLSGHKSPITMTEEAIADLTARIAAAKDVLSTGVERVGALERELADAEARLSEVSRMAAQAEGEAGLVQRNADAVRQRLEAARGELAKVDEENTADQQRRANLSNELTGVLAARDEALDSITTLQDELQAKESASMEESQRLTERRIATSQMTQELSFVSEQAASAERRRTELTRSLEGRESGVRSYEESIARLREESADLTANLEVLRTNAAESRSRIEAERQKRDGLMREIADVDRDVTEKRAGRDSARDIRSRLEVASAEATMRRQNIYDHLQDEYGLFADAVLREPDPEWKGGTAPALEGLENRIGVLQGEIAALGAVNMVAIEECREVEERYAKTKAQEEDLIAAKAQVMELVANLNKTSSEMFRATFEQANANFQTMFKKLFGGGEARLVLLNNEEDPLECGIDIIARPPGKRPQSVTLLSGGERTMTAVGLLFSIFMIKPAPFCMLDELDAALDDANIGRFVEQLKEFLIQSQFLIITHNQHTIAGSDLVYGVSQQEKGISRILSMRLSDLGVKDKQK